jgi:hypothetical protein
VEINNSTHVSITDYQAVEPYIPIRKNLKRKIISIQQQLYCSQRAMRNVPETAALRALESVMRVVNLVTS